MSTHSIRIDTKAIRFSYRSGRTNVFWKDLYARRGPQFFFKQLFSGLKKYKNN